MVSSIGEALLRRLRRRPRDVRPAAYIGEDRLPPTPTADELAHAVAAAVGGRADDSEALALLLLAVDQSGDRRLVERALSLLRGADSRLWLVLDVAARRSWWHAPVWSSTAATRVADSTATLLALILASCHPDGHVREAAVARLTELDDAIKWPALALRCSDWVAQVRARARLVVERELPEATGAVLSGIAPAALALARRQRGRWLAEKIEEVLRTGPGSILSTALRATDWLTRRAAFAAALERGVLELADLISAALRDTDLWSESDVRRPQSELRSMRKTKKCCDSCSQAARPP